MQMKINDYPQSGSNSLLDKALNSSRHSIIKGRTDTDALKLTTCSI